MVMSRDEIDRLMGEERYLDAIDAIGEALDENDDHDLARLMVDARHRAFAALDKASALEDWPRTFPDPFPGETGVPIAAATDLSSELVGGAVTHHGCLQVKGLLPLDDVEWFVETTDRAFEARQRARDWENQQIKKELDGTENTLDRPSSPWFDPIVSGTKKARWFGGNKFVRVADVPSAMHRLVRCFEQAGLTSLVSEYLGERPAMIANKWILRRSPSGVEGTDYHQDGRFLGEGIRTIDCWIALSPCGPGTGRPGIDVVARRYPLLESDELATFDWSLSEHAVLDSMPDIEISQPVFEPGDALFFDELLPHRTAYGPELGSRYAIESWFVAPSSYPDIHVPLVL